MGLVVVIPQVAGAVWVLGRLGLGNQTASLIEALRLTFVFAGLAAVLTSGGVGRLAAEAGGARGRRRAALVAARAMAAGGAALILLAAIPLGDLPATRIGWIGLAAGGALGGVASGVVIGLVCGGPLPGPTDLARWPGTRDVREPRSEGEP